MKRGQIDKIWGKVLSLWNIMRDPKSDIKVKGLAIGALIYLISPLDVVPDFIPLAGLADDAGIILYAISQIAKFTKNKQ